ncbi:uncharacterized protein N7515_009954 [Penicillium bovifimosum]|uniref:Uncharacterized protein n=1 Tax=Penicillium bovifimosum TaxID=126998 RepID=A0A9W9GHY0_9EURO|nr:uncharacterized protein N7515_009954 [Penicillium bovifimosum]KAJ5120566.1 hypothetical protein N7515_009954 [Penicillium bovifimosum]
MADEKRQNPFRSMGSSNEAEAAEHPPAYRAPEPSTQASPSTSAAAQRSTSQTNKKTIAIPAISSSSDSPFIRAYPPILRNYQLPKESFLTFLDQLNKDIAASPPLQVLDATGGILNSVPILFPLHWIGSAVSGLANLGSQGMSKSRTDSSIKQANRDIFGPRGLKVEVAKLDALAHIAQIPILDSQGKINRQAPLFLQLRDTTGGDYERQEQERGQGSEVPQCIRALQPWIAELEFEILPWSSKSKLTRFNAALRKRNGTGTHSDGNKSEDVSFRKALWLIIREVEVE